MLKYLITLTIFISIAGIALGKSTDTAVMFFDDGGRPVRSITESAYYMLIMPPDANDTRYNIQEFYKSGTLKLTGKADGQGNVMRTGAVLLDGECTSYFKSGKKSSLIHYNKGYKEGIEEMYYPDGNVWCRIKHSGGIYSETSYFNCYDPKGAKLCDAGTGKWVVYDDSCAYVREEGMVKNGKKEGDWKGEVPFMGDTIKSVYHYKHNMINGSEGYDKTGKAYSFVNEFEAANYRSGPLVFIERLRNRIKLPRDINGMKSSIDTMHVSFVVERDGKLSQFEIYGDIDQQLKDAVFAALEKSNEWMPSKICGVPLRTRVVLPLNVLSKWNDTYQHRNDYYGKEVWYKEAILKD